MDNQNNALNSNTNKYESNTSPQSDFILFNSPTNIKNVIEATQKNLKDLQQKNELIAKEFQQLLLSTPTEVITYLKDQQQKSLDFNNKLMSTFITTPVDYSTVTHLITEQTKTNFNFQLEALTKNTEKFQNIFNKYFSK